MTEPAKFSWRCFLGIHHWTKWSAEKRMFGVNPLEPTILGQERFCINCNRIESRPT